MRGWPVYRILDAIARAVAMGDLGHIDANIRLAYEAGATVGQVLAAIEVGRCLGPVPPRALAAALAAARDWSRAARPGLPQYVPASRPQPVRAGSRQPLSAAIPQGAPPRGYGHSMAAPPGPPTPIIPSPPSRA